MQSLSRTVYNIGLYEPDPGKATAFQTLLFRDIADLESTLCMQRVSVYPSRRSLVHRRNAYRPTNCTELRAIIVVIIRISMFLFPLSVPSITIFIGTRSTQNEHIIQKIDGTVQQILKIKGE